MKNIIFCILVLGLVVSAQNLQIYPQYARVSVGNSLEFNVVVTDENDTMSNPGAIRWFVMGRGNKMDNGNKFTAGTTPGFYLLTANVAGSRATAVIEVVRLTITPPVPVASVTFERVKLSGNKWNGVADIEINVNVANAALVRLFAVGKYGAQEVAYAQPCYEGLRVTFQKVSFSKFNTQYLEVRVFDSNNRELARAKYENMNY